MMVRIFNYCFRGSSSMQAKVPRHGKNHVQEIFLSKGTKRLKLRENVTFAVSMKICGNKCPTPQFGSINLCASVNFYFFQK